MNSFSVQTYSAKDVSLIISGYKVSGWNTIRIARRSQGFIPYYGIRGSHTRIPSEDSSANITLSLNQTSASNDVLSQVHELDLEQGTGRLLITLKDLSGRSVFQSTEAYITGFPTVGFSGNIEERVWDIFCQTTETFTVGGNTRPSTGLFDSVVSGVQGLF